MVNTFLLAFSTSFARPLLAAAAPSPPSIAALTQSFLTGMTSGKLHWRAAIIAHTWFNLVAPLAGEPEVAVQVLQLQFQQITSDAMLLVRVCPFAYPSSSGGDSSCLS